MERNDNEDGLTINFSLSNGTIELDFTFLGYRFAALAPLEQARHLYKKLDSSRHWRRSGDNPRKLTAIGSDQFEACPRCNGRGDIPRFKHVQEGICFLCWGSGGKWGTEDSGGAIYDFSIACKDQELVGLYSQLQKVMQESARKMANAPAEAEMERIRERRKARALEKERLSKDSRIPKHST